MKQLKKIFFISSIFLGIFITNVYALDVDYIRGIDRYETASLIASKMNYSSAILVNGNSLVDGLSSSGLSGATNSPILLTSASEIPQTTLNKLNGVNKVYIVGGTMVISSNIEEQLKNSGKTVIRLSGDNRFETSKVVANEIERIKGVSEVYYVNGIGGEADAMSIAPVAAKSANPVIITDGYSTDYIKSVPSYSIGGTTVLSTWFDGLSTRIGGLNRFETNKKVIKNFYSEYDHVNLSKAYELIDALTASALKQPVVLASDDSDKTVINGAKSLTVFGNISEVAISRAKAHVYGDKVVFYVQHQDDETLFGGSAIVDALHSVGRENVYVVLITQGDASGVFSWQRYALLSHDEKVGLRNNEFKAAVEALGVSSNNVIMLNQKEHSIDSSVVMNEMLKFENEFDNVTHVTHSYKFETHPQHIATGGLLKKLHNDGLIKDCRFMASYKKISQIGRNQLIESIADNDEERQAVINACNEYKLDKKDMIREGIGYKSVTSMFDEIMMNKELPSYLHEGNL